jgi:hypothetical protein
LIRFVVDALRGLPTIVGEEVLLFFGDKPEEEEGGGVIDESKDIQDNEEEDCGRDREGVIGDNVCDNDTVTVSGASARPICHNKNMLKKQPILSL